jgi:phosphonate transport system permease protein
LSAVLGNPLRERGAVMRRYAIMAVVLLLVGVMVKHVMVDQVDWKRLGGMKDLLKTLSWFAPDWRYFPAIARPLLETLLMAFWGTFLAVCLAIPVAFLAARNVTPHRWITYPLGRAIIVLTRSIHEVIFALVYVAALGLGPLPGILALASRSLGFMAKTTAEAIENVNRAPIEAMEAAGAGRLATFAFAVVPQVFPVVVGNVIFSLEINLRRASILGLVGAGGIGYVFAEAMQMLQYDRVATIVIGLVAMVIAGEFVSNRLRARFL